MLHKSQHISFNGFFRTMKTEHSADSLYDMSLQDYVRRKDKNTRASLNVPLVSVLEQIGANIPRERILLNHKVAKISRQFIVSNGRKITVRTTSGRIFYSRRVIVTTSLGVLKATMDTLFQPALSFNKRQAIQAAGFGNLAKIALIFDEEFWNQIEEHIANLPLFWTQDNNVDRERRYVSS